MKLREVDSVEITTLVDNYTDIFLTDQEHAKRNPMIIEKNVTRGLLADHGLSLLLEFSFGEEYHKVLFDGGWLKETIPHNLKTLGINLLDLDGVVLSHGHQDHFAGLLNLYELGLIPQSVPLYTHPEVFKQRDLGFPNGGTARMPQLLRYEYDAAGVKIVENRKPSLLFSDSFLLSGEIDMVTDFEVGFPIGRKLEDGVLKNDFKVIDEQIIIFNVKGKGLVIVTACSHPGIINIILHAKKITGVDKIYAIIGGFHLTGFWQKYIPQTIEKIKEINPEVIVPTHCTGWKAITEFEKEFSKSFILNSVGTKILL